MRLKTNAKRMKISPGEVGVVLLATNGFVF